MLRSLSLEAAELVRKLATAPGLWKRMTGDGRAERRKLVAALVDRRELASVRVLAALGVDPDHEVARLASSAVAELVARVPAREFPRLDVLARSTSANWCAPPWPQTAAFAVDDEAAIACLGVMSCAADGRVREQAVARLARSPSPGAVPWLLLRVNDWVPAVRTRAATAVVDRARSANAAVLVANLELVTRLESCGRADHTPLVRAVRAALLEPAARDAVVSELAHGSTGVRALCVDLLLAAEDVEPAEVARLVRHDPAARVRLLAARACRRRLGPGSFGAAFEVLGADLYPPIRREMLEGLVEHEPALSREELLAALLDRAPGVRDLARYFLEHGEPPIDVASVYRGHIAREVGRELPVSLLGLGETGSADDAAIVAHFVNHAVAAVRRAAVHALARLAPEASTELLRGLIHDPSPSVSREAAEALRPRVHRIDAAALWQDFEGARFSHVRRRLISLFARHFRWPQLDLLLRAVAHVDEEDERGLAVAAVGNWLARSNRCFVTPSEPEADAVRAALANARPWLSSELVEGIGWSLR